MTVWRTGWRCSSLAMASCVVSPIFKLSRALRPASVVSAGTKVTGADRDRERLHAMAVDDAGDLPPGAQTPARTCAEWAARLDD